MFFVSYPIKHLKFKIWLILFTSVILVTLIICGIISFFTKDTHDNNKPQIPEIICPQENTFPEHIEDDFER